MKKLSLIAFFLFSAMTALAYAIPWRGVVEGYYGRPWGTEGRLSLLKFMGEHNLNVFIYGPKDDPYHHTKWREPYPQKELEDFQKLLKVAKENNIRFYWAIHLGGTFQNTPADYAAMFQKLNWMYDDGFRAFAVFFDDFGSADAKAHAEICNRILHEFIEKKGDCAPLVMCPNVYWGSGHSYQKTLGAELDKKVQIMWTGHGICYDIKASDVAKITEDLQRAPYVWWNWPVNDYCRSKLLLGRTYGLDDCPLAGFVSNPMENCEASKIALYSIAEWCKNPKDFDSQKAWEESFAKLYPDPVVAKAMRIFAEHNSDQGPNGHGYRREESVDAAPLCAKAQEEYKTTGNLTPETTQALAKLFREIRMACRVLETKLPKGRYDLGWEIEGWVKAQQYQVETGLCLLKLLAAPENAKIKILHKIRTIRALADQAAKAHQEKFAAATFANDRGHINRPKTATRELTPLLDVILESELKKLYAKTFGHDFDGSAGFDAFSNAKGLPPLHVNREGKYAGIVRIMEMKEIKPGESFGLRVPEKWQTDYFHAKLGEVSATQAGIIEVSKNGKSWSKLNTQNNGENMELRLNVDDGWRWARYRNTSNKPVQLKINQFKFDVRAGSSQMDELLDEIVKKTAKLRQKK